MKVYNGIIHLEKFLIFAIIWEQLTVVIMLTPGFWEKFETYMN
jgi:hypothetical protein